MQSILLAKQISLFFPIRFWVWIVSVPVPVHTHENSIDLIHTTYTHTHTLCISSLLILRFHFSLLCPGSFIRDFVWERMCFCASCWHVVNSHTRVVRRIVRAMWSVGKKSPANILYSTRKTRSILIYCKFKSFNLVCLWPQLLPSASPSAPLSNTITCIFDGQQCQKLPNQRSIVSESLLKYHYLVYIWPTHSLSLSSGTQQWFFIACCRWRFSFLFSTYLLSGHECRGYLVFNVKRFRV